VTELDSRPGAEGPGAGDPAAAAGVRLVEREEDGRCWPVLLWAPGAGWRMVSTAVVGGGIGPRAWWLNAKVAMDYDHPDPAAHVREIAAAVGAVPDGGGPAAGGVGMLTAADVTRWTCAQDQGVTAVATVGLGLPVWAAADDATVTTETGTINVLVRLPVLLSDAALVNAVVTATEAKTQALVEAGVPGSGTSSDAVCVACPEPGSADGAGVVEQYGGPRSLWGLRVARAVHRAVALGTADWTTRHPDGDPHRRWPRG
jgi:adenosylcobinamide amidohydrolase